MLDIPFNPDALGDTMLARYLRADPGRLLALTTICDLLDDDGRVGDRCRYYVTRSAYRRAVLRGVLICEAIPLPSWVFETLEAGEVNRAHAAISREQYNARRREKRQRPKTDVASVHTLARTLADRRAA